MASSIFDCDKATRARVLYDARQGTRQNRTTRPLPRHESHDLPQWIDPSESDSNKRDAREPMREIPGRVHRSILHDETRAAHSDGAQVPSQLYQYSAAIQWSAQGYLERSREPALSVRVPQHLENTHSHATIAHRPTRACRHRLIVRGLNPSVSGPPTRSSSRSSSIRSTRTSAGTS